MHFLAHGVCTMDQVFAEMASCLRICKSAVICKKLWSFWSELYCWNFFSFSDNMPQSALDRPGVQKTFSFATERPDA